jgi:hypothetical protein
MAASLGMWDTLSMYLRDDGYHTKRDTEKVEELRSQISGLQKVAMRIGMDSGEAVAIIARVYGWFWDDIPYGAFVEIETFLHLNANPNRYLDPWLHAMCRGHKAMDEYRRSHEEDVKARKASSCDWTWYRAARERVERYGPKHGRVRKDVEFQGKKAKEFMKHYLESAGGVA